MLYLLVAAIAALAAAIAWMWEMKERRMARDPANWRRDLKPERIIKYTRIYLKATGWTVWCAVNQRTGWRCSRPTDVFIR